MFESLSFTKRYVLALTIIAFLSLLAFFNLSKLLSIQSNDAKLVNMSGNQKIITREIAFFAIYYKIDKLKVKIKEMEENHKTLTSLELSDELKNVYYGEKIYLDKKVREYLFHAKRFYENRDGRSQNYVLKNSESLLLDLEKAVVVYLKEAQENTRKLQRVETFILISTLITLLFEALFIFMPANRKINKRTNDLIMEKEFSNAVIESSTNAIITLDSNFKIRTFNKEAQNIFKYTKDEMLNKSEFEKIVPNIYEILNSKNIKNVQEVEAVNKNLERFPIRISFGTSGENKDIAIVANIQDITKEKLNDKILEQQSKFAALGEMIAIIAHQWRQPLAQLSFNCMYIRKKSKDEEILKEAVVNEEIIQFMSETITNFQDFYKKTENTVFNPIISIEQALKIVDSILRLNEVTLIKEIDSQIKIYGNSNSLAHIVLSIIQNSIDIIKLNKIENPIIQITLKDTKEYIILCIKDNAGGIKIEPISDIFKPFNTKKEKSSTGIGLYMSKMIIKNQFKGSIEAKNIEGGAEFTIFLPH
ncbi:PAS domain-containing sensor histidine kinase [Halarcobacter bivalviorum]|uniref:PAS domain-containing sensor histidine kinase n=1 Tax=Halarcobacter bivalviorum TaxID=663364 RepID=UPI00100AE59A|nr:ATP-binding protein [Halarcobacter bivalviorum]RXK04445.1 histidine kinase [Halarcobacter bivalviorum]